MVHRSGDELNFSTGHEMLIGIEPPEGWEPPVSFLRGDVDNDGHVTIGDVSALISYLLTNDATGIDLNAADSDEDGKVTMGDVSTIIEYLLTGSW